MATYCAEKFENNTTGVEQVVCWRQDKHVHDATLITDIEKKLGVQFGNVWAVRANSYRSGLQSCPDRSTDYGDL